MAAGGNEGWGENSINDILKTRELLRILVEDVENYDANAKWENNNTNNRLIVKVPKRQQSKIKSDKFKILNNILGSYSRIGKKSNVVENNTTNAFKNTTDYINTLHSYNELFKSIVSSNNSNINKRKSLETLLANISQFIVILESNLSKTNNKNKKEIILSILIEAKELALLIINNLSQEHSGGGKKKRDGRCYVVKCPGKTPMKVRGLKNKNKLVDNLKRRGLKPSSRKIGENIKGVTSKPTNLH